MGTVPATSLGCWFAKSRAVLAEAECARERTGLECQRCSPTYAAHRQTAGARGRGPGSLQPSPAGRARRRGLMWRSVAEPLPSRGRTSQPFLRRGACGDPTVFSEEVTVSLGPLLKPRRSALTDAVGL